MSLPPIPGSRTQDEGPVNPDRQIVLETAKTFRDLPHKYCLTPENCIDLTMFIGLASPTEISKHPLQQALIRLGALVDRVMNDKTVNYDRTPAPLQEIAVPFSFLPTYLDTPFVPWSMATLLIGLGTSKVSVDYPEIEYLAEREASAALQRVYETEKVFHELITQYRLLTSTLKRYTELTSYYQLHLDPELISLIEKFDHNWWAAERKIRERRRLYPLLDDSVHNDRIFIEQPIAGAGEVQLNEINYNPSILEQDKETAHSIILELSILMIHALAEGFLKGIITDEEIKMIAPGVIHYMLAKGFEELLIGDANIEKLQEDKTFTDLFSPSQEDPSSTPRLEVLKLRNELRKLKKNEIAWQRLQEKINRQVVSSYNDNEEMPSLGEDRDLKNVFSKLMDMVVNSTRINRIPANLTANILKGVIDRLDDLRNQKEKREMSRVVRDGNESEEQIRLNGEVDETTAVLGGDSQENSMESLLPAENIEAPPPDNQHTLLIRFVSAITFITVVIGILTQVYPKR